TWFNRGIVVWQVSQGTPYLRANMGIAYTVEPSGIAYTFEPPTTAVNGLDLMPARHTSITIPSTQKISRLSMGPPPSSNHPVRIRNLPIQDLGNVELRVCYLSPITILSISDRYGHVAGCQARWQ